MRESIHSDSLPTEYLRHRLGSPQHRLGTPSPRSIVDPLPTWHRSVRMSWERTATAKESTTEVSTDANTQGSAAQCALTPALSGRANGRRVGTLSLPGPLQRAVRRHCAVTCYSCKHGTPSSLTKRYPCPSRLYVNARSPRPGETTMTTAPSLFSYQVSKVTPERLCTSSLNSAGRLAALCLVIPL